MPDHSKEPISVENHTLLVQLSDSMANLGVTLKTHIAEQQQENQRLHGRIDATQTQSREGVEEIKDSLAQRGRVSPTLIMTTVALVVSLLTAIGGFTHSYVSGRLENITPLISSNAKDLELLRDWIMQDVRDNLNELQERRSGKVK